MKKLLAFIFILFLSIGTADAFPFFNNINSIIKRADLDRNSTISISVKNIKNGKTVYEKRDEKLLHPASSLKLFTFASTLNTLGKNYEFETKIYGDTKGNIYIKLGADPLLTYGDLRTLIKSANIKKVQKIYIDDTITDKSPYPKGWLSDDLWPNMPKLSPYTLDQNQVKVKLAITTNGDIECFQENAYKLSFINELSKDTLNKIQISKDYGEDTDIINLKGTLGADCELLLPVNNPKFYFIANLKEILKKEKINYTEPFYFARVPKSMTQKALVSHSIKDVGKSILQESNNFASETAFKVAGAKFTNAQTGTTEQGIKMFYTYCTDLGLNTNDIKVADASGVSRYNLLSTNWVSDALIALYKNTNIKDYMATPNIGTLRQRLRHLSGKVWAKTGTLNCISSIEGYIITKDKKELAFVIIIQNFNKKASIIKSFEDDLIDAVYKL